jgi:parallel beta-helix repeat protein
VIDGAGHTLQGPGLRAGGIEPTWITNVTIKNVNIKGFDYGISIIRSSHINIFGNNITMNKYLGIHNYLSHNNNICVNNISANYRSGIVIGYFSTNNMISGNNISTNNEYGISLCDSPNNSLYHNNFVDNHEQVWSDGSRNAWDDDYPSGGNYWSDHVCVGNPSDGTQPYIIDANNIDYYPFQDPNGWLLPSPPSGYTLTIHSAPTEVTFTADSISRTTPWSQTYGEGASVSLVMPEIYTVEDVRYNWNQWSDGNTSRSRTITMNTDITLTAHYTGPYYELTVISSPITNITFIMNETAETTSYSEWLLEGSYTLEMPETHNEYIWSHWFEDGDANRAKAIILSGSATWTGVFALLGDLNDDGKVNVMDIFAAAKAFGSYLTHPRWNPIADVNNDHIVNVRDLFLIAKSFGKEYS